MRFLFLLLFPALLPPAAAAPPLKLDPALEGRRGGLPLFVRMDAQLLPRAGALEAFEKKNRNKPRRVLRREVLSILKQKARDSWKGIAPFLEDLEKKGLLSRVKRFWIVNGFACSGTLEAARLLARRQDVSFVYLQRGPAQHMFPRRFPRKGWEKRWKEKAREALALARADMETPFDPEGVKVPWNLRKILADRVWKEKGITGKGVVVAVLDTGLLPIPALEKALWVNPGEKLDGKDDDGNGYADDLFGWDFRRGSPFVLRNSGPIPHGSMCAGIIAGRPLKDHPLVTGVAPGARVMILQGGGLLEAYQYAADMGADILSMSYMWVNMKLGHYRGVYRCAHEHLAAAGILSAGGAGNFARSAPKGHQIALPKDIPCVIASAGILRNGSKAPPSSEGPCYWENVVFYSDYPKSRPLAKPDVTGYFGGYPVWGSARRRFRRWRTVYEDGRGGALLVGPMGNSFSGPQAVGTAALVLSANPDLNAWDVKKILERTARDLGPKGRDYRFGAGLLQALPAVETALAAGKKAETKKKKGRKL